MTEREKVLRAGLLAKNGEIRNAIPLTQAVEYSRTPTYSTFHNHKDVAGKWIRSQSGSARWIRGRTASGADAMVLPTLCVQHKRDVGEGDTHDTV